MKKSIGIFLILNLSFALAQSISGTVTDENGNGLAGANVTVDGTNMGAAADASGSYSINGVSSGSYTVSASFIGHSSASQSVAVGDGGATANFSLAVDALAGAAVSVVGSRFAHSAQDLAVPVDVFTSQEIRRAGFTETGQILQALAPSFNMPKTSISDGSDSVRPMTLRGLSSGQVLVLINGKRRHTTALVHVNSSPSRGDTGVDLNAIPAAAIQRIEVLRDGAAAQYGSDAIAGVINIVLKTDSDGGTFTVYRGENNHIAEAIPESANLYDWVGNGQRYEWNPTGSVDINNVVPGSEAYITGSEDYLVTDGEQLQIQYSNSVKIGDDGFLMIAAEARTKEASNRVGFQAARLYEVNSDYWSDDVAETQRLQPGSDWYINPQRMIWGDQAKNNFGAMYNSELPVGDKRFYSFGGYTVRHADTGCYTRKPNQGNKTWLSSSPTGFVPHIQPTVTDFSMSTGMEGVFGNWSYDASTTYGSNDFHFNMLSTNASFGPEQIRQYDIGGFAFTQLTNNLDLTTQMGDINLAIGAETRKESYRIYAGETASYVNGQAGTNITGWDSSWVDTLGVTQYEGLNSNTAGGGCQCFSGFRPSNAAATQNANRTSYAGYADAEMELMAGMRVGGALRFENYSDFGSTVNFKGTIRYEVSDGIVARGAVSSGFRAPALAQAFQSKVATNFRLDDDPESSTYGQTLAYEVGNFPVNNPFSQALGAKELTPENSFNLSAGLNANLGGLRLGLDVYSVTITDRIVMTGNFKVSDSDLGIKIAELLATSGVPEATSGRFFFNGVDTKTSGLDLTAAHSMSLAGMADLDLTFSYNTTTTEITEVRTPSGLADVLNADATLFDNTERRTMESSQPKDNLHLTANLSKGNWYAKYHIWRVGETLSRGAYKKDTHDASGVAYPEGTDAADKDGLNDSPLTLDENAGGTWKDWTRTYVNADGESVTDHEWVQVLGNKFITDLELGYDLGMATISFGVNNLFDVMPEKGAAPGDGNNGAFVYSALSPFGMNGKFVYTKLTLNF
ncbi:MAG TPA: TonB-dependent receptor [Rhodospirillales bacterium]|nr:TonB-dependent receptor [Rhodospirillales bacterium]